MKKTITTILTLMLAANMTAAFAEELPVLGSASDTFSVTADGSAIDLGANKIYKSGDKLMLPVRTIAEKLGFTVGWDAEHQGIKLDNGEVNTIIYIGDDNYYMASSIAIGMSAPTPLGAAPELKDSVTYVPAELFNVLFCNPDAVKIDGSSITITSDAGQSAQIPNPFTKHKTIDEAKKAISFDAKLPTAMPKGYSLSYIATMSDNLIELVYSNGGKKITYRTALGDEDISGDYNVYQSEKQFKAGDYNVKYKSNGETSNATWTKDSVSYSLLANFELSENDVSDIINTIA